MKDALVMLGASEAEQENVLTVFARAEEGMYHEEKKHFKIGKADTSSVTINMEDMKEPSAKLASETQDGIRASLPSDLAETLISSINWSEFYFQSEVTDTTFGVARERDGSLMATQQTGGGGVGNTLSAREFPDNGQPILAAKVFDSRWSHILDGLTLLPASEE